VAAASPEIERAQARDREVRAAIRLQERLRTLGIPALFHEATFERAAEFPAIQAAKAFVGYGNHRDHSDCGRGRALVLAGKTGLGKTYAACAALRWLDSGRLWYFPSLCGALLGPETRPRALAEVKTLDVLVLDDVGTEYAPPGGLIQTFFDEIVWHREAERLPTIFTTNLTVAQMRERFSDRIVDRLRAWATVVSVPGESERRPG